MNNSNSNARALRRARGNWLRRGIFLAICVVSSSLLCLAQPGSPEAEADQSVATVAVDGNPLFRVRGVSAYPAAQRAKTIAGRIAEAAADTTVTPNTLTVTEGGDRSTISAADRVLMVVTEADAALENVDRRSLAEVIARRMSEAIRDHRSSRTPQALLSAAGYALGATIVLVLILFVLNRVFRRLWSSAERVLLTKLKASRSRSLQILPSESLWVSLSAMLQTLRTLGIILILYVYANLVLALFPWTRPLAQRLSGILLEPLRTIGNGILESIPNLVFVAILAAVLRYAVKLLHLFFHAIESGTIAFPGFYQEWAMPTYRIVRVVAIAFGLVVAYPYLPGSQSEAFKGVSLLLGVMLSLGSSSAIANVIAGYSLTYRRAFKVGDRVKIGEAIGDVAEVRLQVTHLRSLKNEEIIIPNSEILNNQVINFSTVAREKGLILHTTVGIGYETPWRQVEAMLLTAAERTEGLLRAPAPFILHQALGDFAVTYELNVYSDQPSVAPRLYTALHRNILDVFNEYGVQIMTPAYEGDPEQPKLVPKDKWFEAPAASADRSLESPIVQAHS